MILPATRATVDTKGLLNNIAVCERGEIFARFTRVTIFVPSQNKKDPRWSDWNRCSYRVTGNFSCDIFLFRLEMF